MDAPNASEVFHAGERQMQMLAGARERMAALGPQAIRASMPEQHRAFFAQLPFVIVGSVDAAGQPWASILAGPPGFVSSPDAGRVLIRAQPDATDRLAETRVVGASVALLGIEQHTRRRNRLNGRVERIDDRGTLIAVQQSFGNCNKYIQARHVEYLEHVDRRAADYDARITGRVRQLIARADTFFIATAHPDSQARAGRPPDADAGVDVSHRGGKPGFVRMDGATLTCPDFAGNRFFNTLGNLVLNPRAGLLFIDFENGDMLQVAADARIIFDGPELDAFAGAERLLRFEVHSVRFVSRALPLRWSKDVQFSPVLQGTGDWTRT